MIFLGSEYTIFYVSTTEGEKMTRSEALDGLYAILTQSKDCQNIDATKVAFLLKDIYVDFESRICESCKYANWEFD